VVCPEQKMTEPRHSSAAVVAPCREDNLNERPRRGRSPRCRPLVQHQRRFCGSSCATEVDVRFAAVNHGVTSGSIGPRGDGMVIWSNSTSACPQTLSIGELWRLSHEKLGPGQPSSASEKGGSTTQGTSSTSCASSTVTSPTSCCNSMAVLMPVVQELCHEVSALRADMYASKHNTEELRHRLDTSDYVLMQAVSMQREIAAALSDIRRRTEDLEGQLLRAGIPCDTSNGLQQADTGSIGMNENHSSQSNSPGVPHIRAPFLEAEPRLCLVGACATTPGDATSNAALEGARAVQDLMRNCRMCNLEDACEGSSQMQHRVLAPMQPQQEQLLQQQVQHQRQQQQQHLSYCAGGRHSPVGNFSAALPGNCRSPMGSVVLPGTCHTPAGQSIAMPPGKCHTPVGGSIAIPSSSRRIPTACNSVTVPLGISRISVGSAATLVPGNCCKPRTGSPLPSGSCHSQTAGVSTLPLGTYLPHRRHSPVAGAGGGCTSRVPRETEVPDSAHFNVTCRVAAALASRTGTQVSAEEQQSSQSPIMATRSGLVPRTARTLGTNMVTVQEGGGRPQERQALEGLQERLAGRVSGIVYSLNRRGGDVRQLPRPNN